MLGPALHSFIKVGIIPDSHEVSTLEPDVFVDEVFLISDLMDLFPVSEALIDVFDELL